MTRCLVSFVVVCCALARGAPVYADAAMDAELAKYAATRVAMAAKLIAPETPGFAAFDEVCGQDCALFGYGSCVVQSGVTKCAAKIFDVQPKQPKLVAAPTVADAKQAAKVTAARQQIVKHLADVGEHPLWLEEHVFATPPVDLVRYNLTFHWDEAKRELVVRDGKEIASRIKAAPLPKGATASRVAVWYHLLEGGGGAGHAVLRVVGTDGKGQPVESVAMTKIPWAGPSTQP